MKKEIKKSISIILALLLIITSITACSKKNGDKDTVNNKAMGRYVEEEMLLPEDYKDYKVVSILKNKDDNLEVYCALYDYETGQGTKYGKLTYKNGTWEENEIPWAAQIYNNSAKRIDEVILGEDGNYYVLATDFEAEDFGNIIYRIVGDQAEPILIPAFDVVSEVYEGYSAKPYINAIGVRSDGSIVVKNAFVQGLTIYSQETGEVSKELDVVSPFLVTGDTVLGASLSGGLVEDKGDIEEGIEAVVEGDNTAFAFDKGNYYIADASGIRRLENSGSIWQTVVDGALTSMSLPSYTIDTLIITQGDKEEYYVKYNTREDSYIFHYYFDETVAATPEREITIYSLVDNSSIRQAISLFQKKRGDVKVNFNVAMSEESGVTINDTIRALNTELLTGKGADIIILDGLPMDSYIEKGVLEDLSDFIQSSTEQGLILSNIAKSYERDGKNYALPARIQIPLFYGKEEILKHLGSTADIVGYINANSDKQIFSQMTYQQLAETLLLTYYNQLFDENGEVTKETFVKFLEDLSVIGKNIGSEEANVDQIKGLLVEGQINLDQARMFQDLNFLDGTIEAGIMQLRSAQDMVFPFNSINQCKLSYTDVNDYFISGLTIGVNAASKNKELVTEFLAELLSEEVQSMIFGDGFPVNEKALDSWAANKHDGETIAFSAGEDMLTLDFPTVEESAGIYAYAKKLSTPLSYNKLLIDAIVTNITEYLTGNVTAEQAAQDTINLVNTYLSE